MNKQNSIFDKKKYELRKKYFFVIHENTRSEKNSLQHNSIYQSIANINDDIFNTRIVFFFINFRCEIFRRCL